jgi:hypothetical protein
MKTFLIGIGAILLFCANSFGQSSVSVSTPYTVTSMSTATAGGVGKTSGKDTLTNADTGFLYVWVGGKAQDLAIHMITTTLTGTVATTSNILYGYNNHNAKLTAAQVATVTGTAITGNTTYCAGCVGASSTTIPGASKEYIWQVPKSQGALFDNFFVRTIQTGTCTATYTGEANTE